jgi:phospholipase A1
MPAARLFPRMVAAAIALCLASAANAHECAGHADDSQRLACYDRSFGRAAQPTAAAQPGNAPQPANAAQGLGAGAQQTAGTRAPMETSTPYRRAERPGAGTTLAQMWDLTGGDPRETFELRTYKPTYLLLATHTNRNNAQPASQNAANVQVTPLPIEVTEAQFQFSFKSKVRERFLVDNGSLWMGYTQSSRWQVYNSSASRPFRETNYEPEAMFVLETQGEFLGWQSRMAGISITHQSNGRALPLSRSWNRVIAQWGLEKGDAMVLVRPWWRIPEKAGSDDNPRIQDYVGRGEVVFAQRFGQHVVSVQARHSLRTGNNARGSAKFEWSIPISGYLKAHLSLFTGYGESMIDFNHRQTVLGAGVSLVEWR